MKDKHLRTVICTVLFFFLTTGLCFSGEARPAPYIAKGMDGQVSLHLPDKMADALHDFDPDFTVKQISSYPGWFTDLYEYDRLYAPFAVIGDYNGDEILDVAMEGDNRKHDRTLVLLSKMETFEVVAVRNGSPKYFSLNATSALFKAPPGTYLSPIDDEVLELDKDGFGVAVIGKGMSSVFHYKKGVFESFLTGD